MCNDNEGLLKKILDFMNKVSESERLQSEAEENTKTIMERAETLEKELEEAKKMLADKDVELKGYDQLMTLSSRRLTIRVSTIASLPLNSRFSRSFQPTSPNDGLLPWTSCR